VIRDEPTPIRAGLAWRIPGVTMDWRETDEGVAGTGITVDGLLAAALLFAIAISDRDQHAA
jgi:hypothetical protein